MPNQAVSKSDLLDALRAEQAWWDAVFSEALATAPLTGAEAIDETWTVAGLLAHIDGWRRWTLARLVAAGSGIEPVAPWPAGMSEATEPGVDEINGWFDHQASGRSFDEVRTGFASTLASLVTVVSDLPERDLLTPGRVARIDEALADLPIGPALIGYSISHVHIDHAAAVERWLGERLGRSAALPPPPSNFGYDDAPDSAT